MKKLALVFSLIASVTVFSACGAESSDKELVKKNETEIEKNVNDNIEKENNLNVIGANDVIEGKSIEVNNAKEEGQLKAVDDKEKGFKLYYYDVIEDKIKTENIETENINENLILEKLKEKEMLQNAVEINKIEKKDKVAIIDFNSAFINTNLGSGVEAMVLESIAKSFLDGLKLDKLKITVDGKVYESGHIMLEENYYFKK